MLSQFVRGPRVPKDPCSVESSASQLAPGSISKLGNTSAAFDTWESDVAVAVAAMLRLGTAMLRSRDDVHGIPGAPPPRGVASPRRDVDDDDRDV